MRIDKPFRRIGLGLGPLVALAFLLVPTSQPLAMRAAAVAALMAIWWLTEALPIPATALIPLVLFPLLGIARPIDAAAPYANPVVFLFLGGFMLALAMQRWGLHRRIALGIVARVGTKPPQLVLGFMLATAFISMWISNTATTAMMVPIGLAICELLKPAEEGAPFPFATALMLGIAYAATIGGVATLIGTPPNAVFAAATLAMDRPVSFADWMVVGVPVVVVLLPLTWLLLLRLFPPGDLPSGAHELLHAERAGLGRASRGEKLAAAVFVFMAVGWVLREPKALGAVTIPGITTFAPGIDDATIAIAGALLLFLLPVDRDTRVLEWEDTRNLPWGVLLLFGGGLSLARSFETSGLSAMIGRGVESLGGAPEWVLLLAAAGLFMSMSELASNTAIASMAMPILAATAEGFGMYPLPLMAVGALACSCAFMMPVGTPPNAIVFASGYIRMGDMAKAGIWLNLLALLVVVLAGLLLTPLLH